MGGRLSPVVYGLQCKLLSKSSLTVSGFPKGHVSDWISKVTCSWDKREEMAVEEEEAQTEVVTAVGSGILERGDKSWDAVRAAVLSLRTLVKGQSFSEMQKSDAAEQRGDS